MTRSPRCGSRGRIVPPEARLVHDCNATLTLSALSRRSAVSFSIAPAALGLLQGVLGAREADAQSWRATQGEVRIAVPLRPGGGFEAKTQSLKGKLTLAAADPAQLPGAPALGVWARATG